MANIANVVCEENPHNASSDATAEEVYKGRFPDELEPGICQLNTPCAHFAGMARAMQANEALDPANVCGFGVVAIGRRRQAVRT